MGDRRTYYRDLELSALSDPFVTVQAVVELAPRRRPSLHMVVKNRDGRFPFRSAEKAAGNREVRVPEQFELAANFRLRGGVHACVVLDRLECAGTPVRIRLSGRDEISVRGFESKFRDAWPPRNPPTLQTNRWFRRATHNTWVVGIVASMIAAGCVGLVAAVAHALL